jgi:hypothetical protein
MESGYGFVTWNVRNLYRTGLLTTVASELAKCNLDLVAVHEDIWVEGVSQQTIVHFSVEMGLLIIT